MKIESVGTVIAERALDGQYRGKPCKVIVRVGKPFEDEQSEAWYCPYSVVSPKGERLFYGAGIDSMEALRIAISNVGAELATLCADMKLKWANMDDLVFMS